MKIFGLVGWPGSGKTTLAVRLVPELVRRGVTVSVLARTGGPFDIDRPGKDSYEHRRAGAAEVLLSSARRWALVHENRGGPAPGLDALIARMAPVDLLLVEGVDEPGHDRLEVRRGDPGRPWLHPADPRIVAVASDVPPPGAALPVFALDEVPAIADFVLGRCALRAA